MSATYTYQKFEEECKSLTLALLDSDLHSSYLTKCEQVTIAEDDILLDFLPTEIQTHLTLQFSKPLSDETTLVYTFWLFYSLSNPGIPDLLVEVQH